MAVTVKKAEDACAKPSAGVAVWFPPQRNSDNFFKDRAWMSKEIPELAWACREAEDGRRNGNPLIIDVGCGVGNSLVPILLGGCRRRELCVREFCLKSFFERSLVHLDTVCYLCSHVPPANPRMEAVALDCSPRAVAMLIVRRKGAGQFWVKRR